jgi:urea transport system permease protein
MPNSSSLSAFCAGAVRNRTISDFFSLRGIAGGRRSFDASDAGRSVGWSIQVGFVAVLAAILVAFSPSSTSAADSSRQVIAKALATDDVDEQTKLVASLVGAGDDSIRTLLVAWKEGGIFLYTAPAGLPGIAEGAKIAVTLTGEKGAEKDTNAKLAAIRVDTAEPLKDAEGKPVRLAAADLDAADTTGDLRLAMKIVLDVFAMAAPDAKTRIAVIRQMGLTQDAAQLPALQARQKIETDPNAKRALREAIDQLTLKNGEPQAQIAAANELAELSSLASHDALLQLSRDDVSAQPEVAKAARAALAKLDTHLRWVNFYGTLFHGLSLGSVLLVVAIGLAITFGLMGVINMAHGELIAVGAYTTYCIQNIFGAGLVLSPFGYSVSIKGFGATGVFYQCYFAVAIPLSFLVAALVGVVLERTVIQWLYRRPLESLLATWGVSLILQQLFRLIFGANNVQVDSPAWLSGNWTAFDVIFGWNRIFVISFAVAIIAGTWAILNKTPLGLLIRAVMQNRQMAACMGVRTERVNMFTFAFGSGLAGLAGAFLSQIGNVGPGMGQDRIVDAFMTVVVGGVGSIFGTVISALGIGVTDETFQQVLGNPVLGKILVLGAIILFLQWRPAGLFVTKSRSLEG